MPTSIPLSGEKQYKRLDTLPSKLAILKQDIWVPRGWGAFWGVGGGFVGAGGFFLFGVFLFGAKGIYCESCNRCGYKKE